MPVKDTGVHGHGFMIKDEIQLNTFHFIEGPSIAILLNFPQAAITTWRMREFVRKEWH
jgi:hypothetical protein